MARVLFPEHGRYTKKKVRGYLHPRGYTVHLVYPDNIENPFLGGGFIEDSIGKFREETGISVSWTPVGSFSGLKDDSSSLIGWEEVIV